LDAAEVIGRHFAVLLNRRPKRGRAKKMMADGGLAFDSSCSP